MCPDRRQHVLPLMFARPITGVDYVVAKLGAIATILFAFSFLPQVVLFVGNMLVSDSALDYFTGHLDVLWKVPVAVAAARRVLRRRSASRSRRSPTAGSSRARRSSACSSSRRSRPASSSATSSSTAARPPRSSTCSRCRCTCATSCSSATSIPSRRSPASTNGGLLAIVIVRRRAARPASACCCAATAGWNDDGSARLRERTGDPAFAPDATVDGRQRVGVVRAEGRAVGAQLLVRPGRDRPARTRTAPARRH